PAPPDAIRLSLHDALPIWIWLHILPPVQTVTLMVSYSVLLQGYGVWKLRHALAWRTVAPFIISSAIGVPIGAMLLAHINPAHLRDRKSTRLNSSHVKISYA